MTLSDRDDATPGTNPMPRPAPLETACPAFRRILVPLDGSRPAEHAIAHAAALARGPDAEIQLLRVLEPHLPVPDLTLDMVDWRLLRLEAEAYLGEIAARLRAQGHAVATAVVEGKAADEIVQHVRTRGVELVVASAFGQGGAREVNTGGTVHKLLARGASSTMLVRPAAEGAPPDAPAEYRRILAPVDGSAASAWGLCHAAALARAHGAELIVLHVDCLPAPAWGGVPPTPEETEAADRLRELRLERARGYLERMRGELASADLAVRGRVTTAERVERAILDVAGEEGADLIALSAHGQDAAPGACGAVTERLLRRSPVPVLVFQDRPDDSRPERR